MPDQTLIGLSVALGCGLLIGLERERRKQHGSRRLYAGIRTFAVAALTGALAQTLTPTLVVAGAVLIVALSVASYIRDRSEDIGATTQVALFATYLLGVNAVHRPDVSAGAAVILAALLFLREPLHRFSEELLSAAELRDGLLLAGAALVVLPLLPDRPESLLLGVNPRRLWGLVTLILALQACGYIGLRIGGTKVGLPLSGFASGLISSVATIAAMGARARQTPELTAACVSGALLSNVSTFLLLIVVVLVLYPAALASLGGILFGGLAAAAGVAVLGLQGQRAKADAPAIDGHAFSLVQALVLAGLLTGASLAVGYVNASLGSPAATVAAALAGFVDAHAAASSVLSLGANGALSGAEIPLPVLLAISTNCVSKLVSALAAGGLRFGLRIGLGLAVILGAAWLPYILGL